MILQDKTWLTTQLQYKSVNDVAKELGINKAPIYSAIKNFGIVLKKEQDLFVQTVYHFLLPYSKTVLLNDVTTVPGLSLDIYIPEKKVAIMCNNTYWNSENQGKDRHYHVGKTKICEANGIQLIHLWSHDWDNKSELIKTRLMTKIGSNDRVFARKTCVHEISSKICSEFLKKWHIQGSAPAQVKYGIYDGMYLVAVMTFGKSRYNKAVEWELIRYCSSKQVVGGGSKILKHFIRQYSPKSIISYSDKSWNTGNLYKTLGFTHSHTSGPAYYYTKDYSTFENRVAYQKHKLEDRLATFDESRTEWENMQENGYDRTWDCGNDVWVWTESDK